MQNDDLRFTKVRTVNGSNRENFVESLRWKSDIIFFCEQHERMMAEVVTRAKSDTPFCLIDSSGVAYQDYYKQILVNQLKADEGVRLLFFDPKFGDNLVGIINKELDNLPLSKIANHETNLIRKILIIDNESYTSDLEWVLIDSLTSELRAANIGVVLSAPVEPVLRAELLEKATHFEMFNLRKLEEDEVQALMEQAVNDPEKALMLAMLYKEECDSVKSIPRFDKASVAGNQVESEVKSNFWRRLRGLNKWGE